MCDRNKPCISGGTSWKSDFDAGHLFSVKQFSGIRFNEFNCHAQSIGENRHNYGNFESYILNIKDRIGTDEFDKLKKRANECKRNPKKWTIHKVLEIKKYYLKKIKEIE